MTLTPEQKPLLIGNEMGGVIHRRSDDRQLEFHTPRQALATKAEFAFGAWSRTQGGKSSGGRSCAGRGFYRRDHRSRQRWIPACRNPVFAPPGEDSCRADQLGRRRAAQDLPGLRRL